MTDDKKPHSRQEYLRGVKDKVRLMFQNQGLKVTYVKKIQIDGYVGLPAAKDDPMVTVFKKLIRIVGPGLPSAKAVAAAKLLIESTGGSQSEDGITLNSESDIEFASEVYERLRKQWVSRNSGTKAVIVKFTSNCGTTKIGWSLCDNRDNFNRYEGIMRAVKNAITINEARDAVELFYTSGCCPNRTVVSWIETQTKQSVIPHSIVDRLQDIIMKESSRTNA